MLTGEALEWAWMGVTSHTGAWVQGAREAVTSLSFIPSPALCATDSPTPPHTGAVLALHWRPAQRRPWAAAPWAGGDPREPVPGLVEDVGLGCGLVHRHLPSVARKTRDIKTCKHETYKGRRNVGWHVVNLLAQGLQADQSLRVAWL